MARFLPKSWRFCRAIGGTKPRFSIDSPFKAIDGEYSNSLIKQIVLWGLLLFYSLFIVVFYGLKIMRSYEGFDVSDTTTGNVIVLDNQYATSMPNTKLDDIYSYTAEPVPITPALNSNTYDGSPGFIGGGTLSPSSIAAIPTSKKINEK